MSLSSHRQQQQSRVEVWNAIRPDPNYIPGLGRGAQGFTTRSDIGPSKFTPTPAQQAQAKQEQDEAAAQQDFDHFMGADAGAFAYGDYDEDDKEADEIYASVEDIMDKRRKVHREKRERQEYEEFRKENPLIKEMFSDLKRDLAKVSEDEWRGIPEIGDYTIKRRKRFENYSANSDSMLAGALATATGNTGNQEQPGAATPGTMTDLTALGQGKKQMLGVNLDRMADSVSGQTTVDPTGYLTSLNSKTVTSAAEVQDIKRARSLMKSMVTSNPGNARGWIAYARLEEVTGNLKTARTLISQGIDACPKNEDVWLEAARLQTQENARALLARGVQSLPTSVKLWMQAARAEPDDAAKRRVLRKALERNSGSVRLWKAAVELHEEEEALVLLSRAVECCPDQVDLWIALVRLEPDFERAKKALNRAVKAIPTEPILYITAAKLQEAHGDVSMVRKIISKAISRKLPDAGVIIDRETWLKEAETAEKASPPMTETCRAIVSAVVDVAVDERERKDTYHRDADEAARRGSVHTARAILEHACEVFPESERSWRAAAELEKSNGNQKELHAVLERAVAACPNSVILWLMNAKEHWLANDVPTARAALEAAHNHNPDSEEIVLAAFKLEFENGEAERARVIAIRAKDSLADPSARVWMKAAVASRELGKDQEEKQLLEQGVSKFGDAPKLHMMLAQWFDLRGDLPGARRALQTGLKHSPRSVPLWLMLARLEERQNNVPAARALLEQARLRVSKSPELWRAAVRTELRCGNSSAAEVTLNRALQDCDGVTEGEGVGSLWAMYIHMAPRPQRKARMADAVRKTDDDAAVFAAFGRVFMADRKYDKARKYFQRAVTLMPDIGDFWGMWVACETADEKPAAATQIVEQAQKADPHHGERWCQIRKKPSNAHKPFEDLMKLLVIDLEQRPDKDL